MGTRRSLRCATTAAAALLLISACGKEARPTSPTPVEEPTIANVYILPGAADLRANAFGDEPVVIYVGERMRWRNVDSLQHNIVADTTTLPEFQMTGNLDPGGERSFVMHTVGSTPVHCTIHPQMTGTLIVREK